MTDPTPVDRSYDRYGRLTVILQKARDEAFARSAFGEREDVVRQEFDELTRLIEQLAILDMCASFEGGFAEKLAGATDEATKIVDQHYSLDYFIQLRERLVCSPKDYRTLGRICELLTNKEGLTQCVSASDLKDLRELVVIRNNIAHGKPPSEALGVTIEQARTLLNGVIKELWIRPK